jgi:hypothetical protein
MTLPKAHKFPNMIHRGDGRSMHERSIPEPCLFWNETTSRPSPTALASLDYHKACGVVLGGSIDIIGLVDE